MAPDGAMSRPDRAGRAGRATVLVGRVLRGARVVHTGSPSRTRPIQEHRAPATPRRPLVHHGAPGRARGVPAMPGSRTRALRVVLLLRTGWPAPSAGCRYPCWRSARSGCTRPLHAVLRGYKDAPVADARRRSVGLLGPLLAAFVRRHSHCLAALGGVPGLDAVTRCRPGAPGGPDRSTRGRRGPGLGVVATGASASVPSPTGAATGGATGAGAPRPTWWPGLLVGCPAGRAALGSATPAFHGGPGRRWPGGRQVGRGGGRHHDHRRQPPARGGGLARRRCALGGRPGHRPCGGPAGLGVARPLLGGGDRHPVRPRVLRRPGVPPPDPPVRGSAGGDRQLVADAGQVLGDLPQLLGVRRRARGPSGGDPHRWSGQLAEAGRAEVLPAHHLRAGCREQRREGAGGGRLAEAPARGPPSGAAVPPRRARGRWRSGCCGPTRGGPPRPA